MSRFLPKVPCTIFWLPRFFWGLETKAATRARQVSIDESVHPRRLWPDLLTYPSLTASRSTPHTSPCLIICLTYYSASTSIFMSPINKHFTPIIACIIFTTYSSVLADLNLCQMIAISCFVIQTAFYDLLRVVVISLGSKHLLFFCLGYCFNATRYQNVCRSIIQ